jgi:hypothetical protein
METIYVYHPTSNDMETVKFSHSCVMILCDFRISVAWIVECGRLSELGRSCSSLLSCSLKCTSLLQTVDARTMGTRLESDLQPRGSAGPTVGSSMCVYRHQHKHCMVVTYMAPIFIVIPTVFWGISISVLVRLLWPLRHESVLYVMSEWATLLHYLFFIVPTHALHCTLKL